MLGRLLAGAAAWFAAILLFGAAVQYSARVPEPEEPWVVTRATSAHHVLVVDVAARRVHEAPAIAVEIVTPVQAKYEEILIYVRKTGAPHDAAERRIQWTRAGGFSELVMTD